MNKLTGLIAGKSVPVHIPNNHHVEINSIEKGEAEPDRDNSSSWAGFINYTNAKGEISKRRIVCLKIGGRGQAQNIGARCLETQRFKTFRIDRINELIAAETGEYLDPFKHFEQLRLYGALKIDDKLLTDFARLMSFLARCDGEYHPLEIESVSNAIEKYVMRFGGDDRLIDSTVKQVNQMAPDDMDFLKALDRIQNDLKNTAIAKLILECGADVIDADGIHHNNEVQWALELSSTLKQIATNR